MNFETISIKKILETTLSKPISEIKKEDLNKITFLSIDRFNSNGELQNVDYKELIIFTNLNHLAFYNCMINKECMIILSYISKLEILEFINCEFVDEVDDFFDNLNINELIIDNTKGLNNIEIKDLKKLVINNSEIDFVVNNIGILDISRSNVKEDFINNIQVNELIINDEFYRTIENNNYPFKITVKDYTDDIVMVIDNE